MNIRQHFKNLIEKVDLLGTKPNDYDKKMLKKGSKVEREHTDSDKQSKTIAMQHAAEFPKMKDGKIDSDYYDELETVESKLKGKQKKSFKQIVDELDELEETATAASVGVGSTGGVFSGDTWNPGSAITATNMIKPKKRKKKMKIMRRTLPKTT